MQLEEIQCAFVDVEDSLGYIAQDSILQLDSTVDRDTC